ncbi:hypothetical protein AB5J72_12575 [Streptomyces sp. CG1]|uniref:hypothetical protein n=1 Tax=Streptomyces sp. CG1 TaxID=1287523 RepID=UPI0034E25011
MAFNRMSLTRRIAVDVGTGALIFGGTAAFASSSTAVGKTQAQEQPAAAAKPITVTADGRSSATAQCPVGTYVTGGGFKFNNWSSDNGSPVFTEENHPTANGTGWYVKVVSLDAKITVYAVCASG